MPPHYIGLLQASSVDVRVGEVVSIQKESATGGPQHHIVVNLVGQKDCFQPMPGSAKGGDAALGMSTTDASGGNDKQVWQLQVDCVVLGTGAVSSCQSLPLLSQMIDRCSLEVAAGLPVLGPELRWGSNNIFVVGKPGTSSLKSHLHMRAHTVHAHII